MAERSESQNKNRKNVSLDDEQKKAILDKVLSSDKPTAEILRELGISRSTYYNWLGRYKEEGESGLMDKRAVPAGEEEEPAAAVQQETSQKAAEVHPEPKEKPAPKKESAPAPKIVPEKQPEQREKKEEPRVSATSGGKRSSQFSLIATFAIIFVVAGLIISLCMYNSSKYYLVQDGNTISLFKGKFLPVGKERVIDFAPIDVGNDRLNAITDKNYHGEWAAVNALFTYMITQADQAIAREGGPDYAQANHYLALAEKVAYKGGQKSDVNMRYAQLNYTIAVKKVTQAERQLVSMYEDSIDVLKRAKGLGFHTATPLDKQIAVMESKLDELTKWTTDYDQSWLSKKKAEQEKQAAVAAAKKAESAAAKPAPVVEKPAPVAEKPAPVKAAAPEKTEAVMPVPAGQAPIKVEPIEEPKAEAPAPQAAVEAAKPAAPKELIIEAMPEPVKAPKTETPAPETAVEKSAEKEMQKETLTTAPVEPEATVAKPQSELIK